MTGMNSAVDHLRQLREKLVERRRQIAKETADLRGLSLDGVSALVSIQGHIETVDRAIEDEERAQPSFSAAAAIG